MRNEALRNPARPPAADWMRDKRIFLLCFLLMLGALGCESREFGAEKLMWHAHKRAQAIYKNPKGTPPFQLAGAQDAYRDIIKKYPGSLFAVQSQFSIGHLYLVMGEFQKARDEYGKLIQDCGKKGNLCAEALFAVGNSYELEKRWADALGEYKKIMRDFPFSAKSLDLPVYIVRHYRSAKDEKNIRLSVDDAVVYYRDLKSKTKTPNGSFVLDSYAARVYLEAGQWPEALDSLEKLIRDYPKNNPEEALLMKAMIYGNKLQDKLKAKEELQRIVKDYPQSKLARQAEATLKKL